MTLPRLFDILKARASMRIDGFSFSTKPSPFFSTWSSASFTASSPDALSPPPSEIHLPAFLKPVYSISPRIMPWLTSF